jgi:hypothetical protein
VKETAIKVLEMGDTTVAVSWAVADKAACAKKIKERVMAKRSEEVETEKFLLNPDIAAPVLAAEKGRPLTSFHCSMKRKGRAESRINPLLPANGS